MIKLQDISVIFNKGTQMERVILKKVNLTITKGEVIAITGENGSGKTTLVKTIVGEIKPTHGKIIINNKNYTKANIVERSPIISRVFQDHMMGVALEMSVFENMLFANKRGAKRTFKKANLNCKQDLFIEKLSELKMGLENKLNYKVKFLSGGQRQALSLVMATLRPCKLLVLDEHTSSLDKVAVKMVMDLTMKIVRKYNVTTLMITHKTKEAAYCDRILKIHDGEIS